MGFSKGGVIRTVAASILALGLLSAIATPIIYKRLEPYWTEKYWREQRAQAAKYAAERAQRKVPAEERRQIVFSDVKGFFGGYSRATIRGKVKNQLPKAVTDLRATATFRTGLGDVITRIQTNATYTDVPPGIQTTFDAMLEFEVEDLPQGYTWDVELTEAYYVDK